MAKATEKAAFKREITAQRVLEETANVAFSKITDVIKWENEDGLVDSADLPVRQAKLGLKGEENVMSP